MKKLIKCLLLIGSITTLSQLAFSLDVTCTHKLKDQTHANQYCPGTCSNLNNVVSTLSNAAGASTGTPVAQYKWNGQWNRTVIRSVCGCTLQ